MGTPTVNQYFEAIHAVNGTPSDPNLFNMNEIVAGGGVDSAAISTATSTAVSTVNAAAPDSTSMSQARSQAVSAATMASVADSKAVSGSVNTSVADSKAVSVSGNTSIADSKGVSAAFFASAPSAVVSTADSKAVSVAVTNPGGGRTVGTLAAYVVNNALFNVLDYANGIVINTGVNDAYAAILATDNAAAVSNGEVFFPAGTYMSSGNLTVGRRWRGVGVASIIKPTAAVTRCLTLNSNGHLSNLYIDGVNTTGATGISVGESSLENILSVRDVQVWRFAGVGGRGMKIAQLVTGFFENVYLDANYINLHTNGGNTPSDSVWLNCQFREATTKGVWIETGYGLRFIKPLVESNGEEGWYFQNVGGTAVDVEIDGGWSEDNWHSLVGDPATRATKYAAFVDGANGPSGTIRPTFKNIHFNETARAIHLTNAIAFVVDGPTITNTGTVQVLVDGTSYGQFPRWPDQNGAFNTAVSMPAVNPGVAPAGFNARQRIENTEGAWTTWAPTYGGLGTMTYTLVTTTKARYRVVGKTVYVALNIIGTTGGVASLAITLSLPANIASLDSNLYVPCLISQDGGTTYSTGAIRPDGATPTSAINVYLGSFTNWGLGAGRQVLVSFAFETT